MEVQAFAHAVYRYCLAFSGSVTSWVRSVQRNTRVGGVRRSPHLVGLGADVVYDGARPGPEADRELAAWGLRRIAEADHDHLQPADWLPAPEPEDTA